MPGFRRVAREEVRGRPAVSPSLLRLKQYQAYIKKVTPGLRHPIEVASQMWSDVSSSHRSARIFFLKASLSITQPRQRCTFCRPSSCRSSPYMLATQSASTTTR